jgi:alpha-beta hydrolase superfamily lysophospholipase
VQHPADYREVLISSRSVPIALSVWQAPSPRAVVVFVPGTAVHPLFYEEFLDALRQSGLGVVGVHPQGHGKSPRVRRPLRWRDVVANACDAAAWARDQNDVPVVLVGSSQGGLVALLAAAAGAPTAGVVAHNVFDPADPDSILVTRLKAARSAPDFSRPLLAAAAAALPRLPVPITGYLEPARVFTQPWTRELFDLDPLALQSYPLAFLADLMNVDTSGLYDGSLTVPVVGLAARGDPLFPLAGIRSVTERIVAPRVSLTVLDTDCHLILNEALDLALPVVLDTVDQVLSHAAAPSDSTA